MFSECWACLGLWWPLWNIPPQPMLWLPREKLELSAEPGSSPQDLHSSNQDHPSTAGIHLPTAMILTSKIPGSGSWLDLRPSLREGGTLGNHYVQSPKGVRHAEGTPSRGCPGHLHLTQVTEESPSRAQHLPSASGLEMSQKPQAKPG